MAFWDLLFVAFMPVLKVLLISGLGAFLATQYMDVLTADARKHLNKIVFVVFTPSLMFASLAQSVTFGDLISWWFMPINVFLTFLFGASLGWIIVKITKPPEYLKAIVIANCSAGNLGNLIIIIVPALCQERGSPFGEPSVCNAYGIAYASFSMALGAIFIWTFIYSLVRSASQVKKENELEGGIDEKVPNNDYLNAGERSNLLQAVQINPEVPGSGGDNVSNGQSACSIVTVSSASKDCNQEIALYPLSEKPGCFQLWFGKVQQQIQGVSHLIFEELMSPPTLGVMAGFTVGAIPQLKALIVGASAPLHLIQDSATLLGNATIPSIILILGGNLIKGLRSSKLRPVIVVGVVCVRFILLPAIGICVVKGASYFGMLPADPLYHFVLMIQYTLPPAMNIGTMTQLFNVGEQECSVIFFWTYILAAFALTIWSTVFMSVLFS